MATLETRGAARPEIGTMGTAPRFNRNDEREAAQNEGGKMRRNANGIGPTSKPPRRRLAITTEPTEAVQPSATLPDPVNQEREPSAAVPPPPRFIERGQLWAVPDLIRRLRISPNTWTEWRAAGLRSQLPRTTQNRPKRRGINDPGLHLQPR
jgi:hypothetical protein